jgi:tetratricopeptide (TPR) repeat protein
MKRFLLILMINFTFLAATSQSSPAISSRSVTRQNSAAQTQSTELAEAEQLSNQVIELYKQGEFDKALPLAERALKLRENALGPDHILVANALTNLAEIYLAKGKRKEARTNYQKSIAIYEKNSVVDKTEFANILERYICVLTETDQKDEVNETRKRLFELNNGFEFDETANRPLSLPMPTYLPEAKRRRLSGAVVAEVTIDETGKVVAVKILCGHLLLVQGAEGAIWNGRYRPAMASGHPVQIKDIVTYHFVAQ